MADPMPLPRLTETQRATLLHLLLAGRSDHLTYYTSRGLASLERRGLVVQQGGRRAYGRGALRVLSAEGRVVAQRVADAEKLRGPLDDGG